MGLPTGSLFWRIRIGYIQHNNCSCRPHIMRQIIAQHQLHLRSGCRPRSAAASRRHSLEMRPKPEYQQNPVARGAKISCISTQLQIRCVPDLRMIVPLDFDWQVCRCANPEQHVRSCS